MSRRRVTFGTFTGETVASSGRGKPAGPDECRRTIGGRDRSR